MNARMLAKRTAKSLSLILTLPLYLAFRASSLTSGGCFASFSQGLSLIPGKAGVYLRASFYHLACPETSDEIFVGFLTILSHQNTSIARGVYIGPQCNIGMCSIGENSLVGSGVHILSGSRQHRFNNPDVPIQEQGGTFEKIQIGADCWIGNQAVVMAQTPDKTIIAAGSVVTKPMESGDIVAGNPARVVRNRFVESSGANEAAGAL